MKISCKMVPAVATIFLAICSSSYAEVFPKRGVVVPKEDYRCNDLSKLTSISTWYAKSIWKPKAVDAPCSEVPVQEHVSLQPTDVGANKVGIRIPDETNYLMTFLETPDYEFGVDLTAVKAANKFRAMRASLDEAGRSDVKMLSPTFDWCNGVLEDPCITWDPFVWLDDFMGNCSDCMIHGLAVQHWECDTFSLRGTVHHLHLKYPQYKQWLTSYPCPSATEEETIEYMRAMINLAESSWYGPYVEKYFWEGTRMTDDGLKGNQLLEENSSDLTAAGIFWNTYMNTTFTF